MKYIEKKEVPTFFIEDTNGLIQWSEYGKKRALKQYILEEEQSYLCGYCEAKVVLDNSHLEHIKPKHLDDNLIFDYNNLLVSCDGICFSENNERMTCGHKKGSHFDESRFLNPTKEKNIRDYFIYSDKFIIEPSRKDEYKADYTLSLLQLNIFNNYLPEARKKALVAFQKSVKKNAKKTGRTFSEIANILLNKENLAFISFLKFRYKSIL